MRAPAWGPGLLLGALLLAAGTALARPAASPGAAAAASSASASTAAASASSPRFTVYGLAPAAAGQSLGQAEAALGQPLQAEPVAPARAASAPARSGTPGCHYRWAEGQPGVRYALAGGVLTRVETRDGRYATISGVHVGDSAQRAQQAYGKRLSSTPHPYFDKGRVLTIYAPDRKHALVMETNDQGRIITLRGGRLPEVGWLEGCS